MNSESEIAPRLIIIGASGHGQSVLEIVLQAGKHSVVGFLDSSRPSTLSHRGVPLLGPVEDIVTLASEHNFAGYLLAIGHNHLRRECSARLAHLKPDLQSPTAVHPSAVVASDVVLGEGTVVMAGAIIGSGCVIGRHCIVNSGSQLDHGSQMGDFSSIAPGVVVGGNVSIGAGSAICLGALIIHGIQIGPDTVVGAGAVVLQDIPGFCVSYGLPARVTRPRKPEDRYL